MDDNIKKVLLADGDNVRELLIDTRHTATYELPPEAVTAALSHTMRNSIISGVIVLGMLCEQKDEIIPELGLFVAGNLRRMIGLFRDLGFDKEAQDELNGLEVHIALTELMFSLSKVTTKKEGTTEEESSILLDLAKKMKEVA